MLNLPLSGVRVADFTQALSGPYCTMQLADLGADVVKIERPHTGDDSRNWGPPFVGDTASYFLSVNRSKRSVALDLKTPDGVATALELIAQSDVVVENWTPGTAERLGLGYTEAAKHRPNLVYCAISGYGDDSPLPGYDQVVQGTSGWMSMTGRPDGEPTKVGIPVADVATGMFACQAILAAVLRRDRTGQGAYIDVAMQDSLIAMLAYHAGAYLSTGDSPRRNGNQHNTVAPYGTFTASDGRVNIAVGNDRQWGRLCSHLGCESLATDERFGSNPARSRNRPALYVEFERTLSALTVDQVLTAARAAGVPAGPINTVQEVLDDQRTSERGTVLASEHPRLGTVRSISSPWRFDGVRPDSHRPPPDLGEHTDEVLHELGVESTFDTVNAG
ncbi:formyl-CoA transferase [Rhodococcus sp. SC4]|nr:formyl-CoA transferase [Rhodococcus sp. SC4]